MNTTTDINSDERQPDESNGDWLRRRMRERAELRGTSEWAAAEELRRSSAWQCAISMDSYPLRVALVDAAAARHVMDFPASDVADRSWSDVQKAIERVRRSARMLDMLPR